MPHQETTMVQSRPYSDAAVGALDHDQIKQNIFQRITVQVYELRQWASQLVTPQTRVIPSLRAPRYHTGALTTREPRPGGLTPPALRNAPEQYQAMISEQRKGVSTAIVTRRRDLAPLRSPRVNEPGRDLTHDAYEGF